METTTATTILNFTSARAYNASLKKAFKERGMAVKVEIINSYKFPKCWVHVYNKAGFPNEVRLGIFDACGYDRTGLKNIEDLHYGNIMEKSISAHVPDWEKFFNQTKEANNI
jgi:hypothetical protein